MTREQEAAVIQAVLDGDINAYELLVKEYEKNVYNLALRMTGNSEDAADMAQEAFIKASARQAADARRCPPRTCGSAAGAPADIAAARNSGAEL